MEPIPENAKRGIAIFAHPDDESLWCGGLLARGDIAWTVIASSIPPQDQIRAYQFFDACDVLGVKSRILPYLEAPGLRGVAVIDTTDVDVILTHGAAGEYGHAHHKALHEFFKHDPRAIFSGYGNKGTPKCVVPLDDGLKAKKLAALNVYRGYTVGARLIENFGKKFDLWNEPYC